MEHKLKKILGKNEDRNRYTPIYEYRGFKFKNDSNYSGRYATWVAWGISPMKNTHHFGKNVMFSSSNTIKRVAWDIDRYLDNGELGLAFLDLSYEVG